MGIVLVLVTYLTRLLPHALHSMSLDRKRLLSSLNFYHSFRCLVPPIIVWWSDRGQLEHCSVRAQHAYIVSPLWPTEITYRSFPPLISFVF